MKVHTEEKVAEVERDIYKSIENKFDANNVLSASNSSRNSTDDSLAPNGQRQLSVADSSPAPTYCPPAPNIVTVTSTCVEICYNL